MLKRFLTLPQPRVVGLSMSASEAKWQSPRISHPSKGLNKVEETCYHKATMLTNTPKSGGGGGGLRFRQVMEQSTSNMW